MADYPLPDPKWVERMREMKSRREVSEPIFPGVTGMIDLGRQLYGETKGGIEAFHNILFGKEQAGDVAKLTPVLMNLVGFGSGGGLAINKDKAIRQLARLASQERRKVMARFKDPIHGLSEDIIAGARREQNYSEFFRQLKGIPQSEWERVERVSALEAGHRSRGRVIPYERGLEMQFRLDKPLELTEGTVPHEFAHVRQFVPEGPEKAQFDFMVNLREQIYEEGMFHRDLSKKDIYSRWDPLEMHARNVAIRVDRGEEFGTAVKNALKDMKDYLNELKGYFPKEYEQAHKLPMDKITKTPANAYPDRPPYRGSKVGMKLRPEAKEAMKKSQRGAKLFMETEAGHKWETGAEAVATVPGEPIYYLNPTKNFEEADAVIVETIHGKYKVQTRGGVESKGFDTLRQAQHAGERMIDDLRKWELLKQYAPERIS